MTSITILALSARSHPEPGQVTNTIFFEALQEACTVNTSSAVRQLQCLRRFQRGYKGKAYKLVIQQIRLHPRGSCACICFQAANQAEGCQSNGRAVTMQDDCKKEVSTEPLELSEEA